MHLRALTAICLGLLLGSCSSPPSLLERVLETGTLRVVTQNSPATYYYGKSAPHGIEYELARGFARSLGVRLQIYSVDEFRQLFPDIVSGNADVGAADLAVSRSRGRLVSFGPAYEHVEHLVIYRKGTTRPASVRDLASGSLEVPAGSRGAALLEQARAEAPRLRWTESTGDSTETLIRRVARGGLDYTVVSSNQFALLHHYYPGVKAAFALGSSDPVAWALPRNASRLRERVAAYFARIEATGELQRILNRYYLAAREFDYVGSRAFSRHMETRLPRYRRLFEEAAAQTGISWRLLAAISYQESHWNPNAVSPTGVRGLMMLTRPTAGMMGVTDRDDPRQSILGGARYFRRVLDKIPQRIKKPDRLWLAVAAYNIGFGHLEDGRIITQIQGGNPDRWDEVRSRLPLLSDEKWFKRVARGYARGIVPAEYVKNVRRYYNMLQWMTHMEVLTCEPAMRKDDGSPG